MLRALPPVYDPNPLVLGAAPGHPVAPIKDPACEVHDGVALVVGTLVQQQPDHCGDVREHVGGEEEVDGAGIYGSNGESRQTPMASYITMAKRSAPRAFDGGHPTVAVALGCGVRRAWGGGGGRPRSSGHVGQRQRPAAAHVARGA